MERLYSSPSLSVDRQAGEQVTSCDVEVGALTSLAEVVEIIPLLEEIAREEGWQPGDQLRTHLQAAVFFGVRVGETWAGALQLVRPTAGGRLPIHTVWPELKEQTRVSDAHVVIMALARQARGKDGLLWLLCSEVWRYCFQQHIEQLWLEATPPTLKVYKRLGWPLRVMGPARQHWGEECLPCAVRIMDAAASMAEKARCSPRLSELVLHGLRGQETSFG